jgi:lysozyme family protein
VAPLYKARYWDAVKGDDLPSGVDYAVFDIAVNSGPRKAAVILQEAIGVTADGAIGPKTIQAAKASPPSGLINVVCNKRLDFLRSLPHFRTFGDGWTRRVTEVRKKALEMV